MSISSYNNNRNSKTSIHHNQQNNERTKDNETSSDTESFQQYFTSTIAQRKMERHTTNKTDSSDESDFHTTIDEIYNKREKILNKRHQSAAEKTSLRRIGSSNSIGSISSEGSAAMTQHKREQILNKTNDSDQIDSNIEDNKKQSESSNRSQQSRSIESSSERSEESCDDMDNNKRDKFLNTKTHQRKRNITSRKTPKTTHRREAILNKIQETDNNSTETIEYIMERNPIQHKRQPKDIQLSESADSDETIAKNLDKRSNKATQQKHTCQEHKQKPKDTRSTAIGDLTQEDIKDGNRESRKPPTRQRSYINDPKGRRSQQGSTDSEQETTAKERSRVILNAQQESASEQSNEPHQYKATTIRPNYSNARREATIAAWKHRKQVISKRATLPADNSTTNQQARIKDPAERNTDRATTESIEQTQCIHRIIPNPAANTGQITAKAWKDLFDKLRFRCESTDTTKSNHNQLEEQSIQPTILPPSENQPIGDKMTTDDDDTKNNLRIYFQNINGLNAGKGTGKWEGIIQQAERMKVSIMGLAETNVEWNNHRLKSRLKATLRKNSNHSHMITSTSSIKVTSYYKPGGTATIALNKWSGRITESIEDTSGQGRWSGFTIRAKRPMAVITAYRVPQTSIDSVGYKTAYAQQWAVARMAGEAAPEPRRQTLTDLTKVILHWKKTHDIVLMIDANEQIEQQNSGISKLIRTCALIDIIASRHQQAKKTATYSRGSKRIDYIFISNTLATAVKRCGLLAFFDGNHSDHRGSFLDLDARKFLQDKTPELYDQPMRQLHSKNPKSVLQYKTELWKQLTAHNIVQRSKNIVQRATSEANSGNFAKELNKIANTIQQAMLQAETKCSKKPNAPYSEKLAHLNKVIRYWKTKKSEMKTKRDATHQLQKIEQELPTQYRTRLVKTVSVQSHIQKAVCEYNKEIPNAKNLRQEQIHIWAKAAANRGDKTEAQHFRSMAHAEDSKETFNIIRNIIKPQDRSGLKKLDVPRMTHNETQQVDEQGNAIFETIGDPCKVEELLISRNKKHFSQAQGTPFTTPQLTEIFGIDGEAQTTDDLINGILPDSIDELPPEVQKILRKIAENPPQEYIQTDVDKDQLAMMFKHWKEKTSTSPSGCHLGHWHALLAPDGKEYTQDEPDQDVGLQIMAIHANILNASTTSGVPLDRWKKVHSQMIAKSEGQPRIDKLRVIHLYEADYNGFLKTTWPHRAVHLATKNKRLNYAQGGGQKGRQANHIALQKEMKYQYARLCKKIFATMDNDAKACYDRIIMLLATIASGHFGIPKQARDLQARTIRKMQFHIKTALGISHDYYEDTGNTPLHGSGQGSGSSGPLWLFISSIIMDCFEDIASGMQMANMDKTIQIKQWIDGFVDDTSIFTNADCNNDDPNELARVLQKDAQEWEALLAATGGQLELSKCFYYIMYWKFDGEGQPQTMTKEELEEKGVQISLQETDKETATIIKHLDCGTAHRTLGLYKSPTGDQIAQLAKLQEKSMKIADHIAASMITRSQALIAWNAVYIPAIAYPLVATYLKEEELTKVENKALVSFLPKMGYNRNTARAVIYGPAMLGGVGIKNLYVEQSIEQIKAFTQHTRLDSPLGKTIQINLDWIQLIAGIQKPVLEDTRPIHHIEGEWFISIRKFLRSINGQIIQTAGWRPQLERVNDQCLMDVLTPQSNIEATRINRCRIFLQATTISDITSADGTRITEYAWTPQQKQSVLNPRRSKHDWPRQPRPGPKSWSAWKKAIQRNLSSKGKGQNLRIPLGPWIVSPEASRQHWEWYIDHTSNQIIHNTTEKIIAYPLTGTRGRQQYDEGKPSSISDIPTTAIPTAMRLDNATRNKPNQIPTTMLEELTTFAHYIKQLDPWDQQLIQDNQSLDYQFILDAILQNTRIQIVSDGGVAHGNGSFGWAIGIAHNALLGRGEAKGQRELMQSFRAEGYGMLAALRFILHVCTYEKVWPTSKINIITSCDNLALIQRLRWHRKRTTTTPKNASAPDYDIEVSITSTIEQLADHNIIIKTNHVKGHQDKLCKYHQLPRDAQLNVDADGEATAALQNHSHNDEYPMPAYVKTMLYIDGKPVTSKEATMIRNKFLSTNLRRHITKRENWNANVPDMICWEAHKRSINKLNNTDKTRIHKFLHRCLPTNKKLHDIDQDHPAKCPACNEIETNDHVTACHNPRREKLRKELKSSTAKTMDKHNTHQHIKECILIGMEKFTNNDTTPIELTELSFTPSETIQQAITEQQAIGWTNFYRGRISTKWMDAQQEHARQNTHQGNQDTVQWASQITTTMWHGFLQIWEERKQDQHGRESSQQQATLRRTLLLKVDQLYSKIHTFDEEDKRIFSKPVAHWEQSSNKDIQDWLAIAEPITNKSASRARIRSSHEQPRITQFFSATKQATIQHHAKTHNMRPPRISEREG